MIRPGLERIALLLKGIHLPWKAVHVAGTNGKGSICAYLSALFHLTNIRCGRFTSPHLIDRWDCITVDEKPIAESIFRSVEERVKERNERHEIDASEFELLTATAFEIFAQERVEVAVIECGLGGRLDATNVIETPLVTVISKIGLDHQGLLGDTLKQIAFEKAGIIKTGATCVVDGTSNAEALAEIECIADEKGVDVKQIQEVQMPEELALSQVIQNLPRVQQVNLICAMQAFNFAREALSLEKEPRINDFACKIAQTQRLPGRFQSIDISTLVGKPQTATLDGAHNAQAWEQLRDSVKKLRGPSQDKPLTWVIACSEGKDSAEMFGPLPSTDRIVLTEFGPVDGMPWVKAMSAEHIMSWREDNQTSITKTCRDPLEALEEASRVTGDTELVIAGSLYLVSDILRLQRDTTAEAHDVHDHERYTRNLWTIGSLLRYK